MPSKVRRLSTIHCERNSSTLYLNCRRKQLQKVKLKIVTTKTGKVNEQNIPVINEDSKQEENKRQCRRRNKLKVKENKLKVKVTGTATRRDIQVRVRENHIKIEEGKQTETTQRCIKRAQVEADMSNARRQTRKGEWRVGKKRSRVKKTLVVNHHVPPALSLLLLQDFTPDVRHDDDTLGKGHRKVKPRKKNQEAKLKIRQGTGI